MKCYHCAEEVPGQVPGSVAWGVDFDGAKQVVCCAGCKAVMQAIVDADLGDYYRFRTEPAQFGLVPDDVAARLAELAVFDEPEISERYLNPVEEGESDIVDVSLSVEGLRCGACVWVLERSLGALPGVVKASVNHSSARGSIRFDATTLRLSDILNRVAEVGFQCVPFDVRQRELAFRRESRVFLQRLFVAGIATMQVMMYGLPAYLSDAGDIDPAHEQLLRWASLVLTTPVLLYSALPILKGAWLGLRRRRPGMDVPVSIGILAAFFASVWSTINAVGEVYFDSVAMFVFLLLGARYVEWTVRRRAMRAVDDISLAAPETAQRITDESVETVPAVRLEVGDLILVNDGERIPVDARVYAGCSAINNSLVTGESVPVTVGVGDVLAGGALLTGAPVQLRVVHRQAASTLSVIDRLIDRGASEKPQTVRIADRIATIFVSVLLVFTVLVWLVWLQLDASRAATIAIAVLVVSCPCALSLATPAALAAATGQLLRSRLLISRGHALETLAAVTDIVFDKTGTLTIGSPRVSEIQLGKDRSRAEVLQLASVLEQGSTHPFALALRLAHTEDMAPISDAVAALRELGFEPIDLEHQAGHGVRVTLGCNGVVESALYLGSAKWCGLTPETQREWQANNDNKTWGASEVYLTHCTLPVAKTSVASKDKPEILARFLVWDALRPEVSTLVENLITQGFKVHVLSGDRLAAVQSVAIELHVDSYKAEATPMEKQSFVSTLQAQGAKVLMVGDGINDAPVLASADVSLAAGDATALARTAADVISLLPGLQGLELLLAKSAQTMKIVRQNLAWATLYNITAIPLAAMGLVPPWAAAIGMASSSLLVVINAQRLSSLAKQWPLSASQSTTAGRRLWNRFSF